MTNPEEDALLETAEYQAKIVDGMVAAILDWYGGEWYEIQNADTRIAYLDFDIVQSTIYSEYLEEERIDIYIKEVYSNNSNSIELYVLLNETQKDIVDIKKYTSFTDSELLNDILVEYKIEDEFLFWKKWIWQHKDPAQ